MSTSRRAALAVALVLAGVWAAVHAGRFDSNPWSLDAALLAAYLVLHACGWLLVFGLARGAGLASGGAALFGALFALAIVGVQQLRSDLDGPLLLSVPLAAALSFAWHRGRGMGWGRPESGDAAAGGLVAAAWVLRPGGYAWSMSPTAGHLALGAGYLGLVAALATLVLWLARAVSGPTTRATAAVRLATGAGLLLALAALGQLPASLRAPLLSSLPVAVVTVMTLGLLALSRLLGALLAPAVEQGGRRLGLVAVGIALLVAGAFVASRSPLDRTTVSFGPARTSSARSRVVLLAVDGVDPEVLDRLIANGSLPAFARLRLQGAYGRLTTISPFSPVVWTTIATGATPEQHGVRDFLSTFVRGTTAALPRFFQDPVMTIGGDWIGEERPVSSGTRRVRALWEVLTLAGRRSVVVNWWATYPAEPIDGVMVSNFALPWSSFADSDYEALAHLQSLVSPEQMRPRILETARTFTREAGFDTLTNPGRARRDQTFPRETQEFFVARDAVVGRVFESLLEPRNALETSYFQQVDTGSHTFTEAAFGSPLGPVRPLRIPKAASEALWEELVASAYHRIDALVGRSLDRLAPDQCLVLVSDHGWRYDGSAHSLLPPGVLFLYGPRFRPGHALENASVYDVFPTLAATLDAPLSRRLKGRVLSEAFVTGAEPAVEYIDTYGTREDRVEVPSAGDDGAHIERLRALGYVK